MPAPSDLVHETTTGTGTGNLDLAVASGKRSFNTAFGNGAPTNVFDYYISHRSAAEWERGTGHMSDADTLVRDTVIASSNANAAVNFSAGTKDVANDIPAGNQARLDAANIFTAVQSVYANNSSTTPILKVEQDDTGDASMTFLLTAGTQWTAGIDNSDSDKFKISNASALGTSDKFVITTAGNIGLGITAPAVSGVVQQTTAIQAYGQLVVKQGGNGDGDGCLALGPFGYFTGNNWDGDILFATNLVTDSVGSATNYRTPVTHGSLGYSGVNCRGPLISFFTETGATTGGGSVTPTPRMRIAVGVYIGNPTSGDMGAGTLNLDNALYRDGTQVVGTRVTGWGAPTGTPTRSTFATGSVTLPQLAERVKALIDDLTTHGLIGA